MKSTGQNSERVGYKVALVLAVGLTAFSSAMKELNQLQQFAVETSQFMAQLSGKFVPAQVPKVRAVPAIPAVPAVPQTVEIPQIVEIHETEEVETCKLQQSPASVDLPWLSNGPRTPEPKTRAAVTPRPSQVIDLKSDQSELQIAKLKKIPQIDIDQVRFEFRTAPDGEPTAFVFTEAPAMQFKTKTRRHRDIRINPRDREMLLKTLNRSINLRFAS